MKKFQYLMTALTALAAMAAGCGNKEKAAGVRTDALDASAWEVSEWISAVDAPVVEKEIQV